MQRRTSLVVGLLTLALGVFLALSPVYSPLKRAVLSWGVPPVVVTILVVAALAAGLVLLTRGLRRDAR
jgi:hypothetical protein